MNKLSLIEDLKEDEDFVLKAIAEADNLTSLAEKLTDHFSKYKELGELKIEFDSEVKDWKITSTKGEKRIEYPEGIAKAIMELRK